jgi:hypothetical protein
VPNATHEDVLSLFPQRSADVRRYKFINWNVVLKPALQEKFEKVITAAEQAGYLERLYVRVEREHRTVTLFPGQHPVGASLRKQGSTAAEHGAALVFSQAKTGNVAVLLYPYESEFMRQPEKLIVWRVFVGPNDVTQSVIDAAVADAFRYWRVSSVLDGGSRWDRWRIGMLRRRDRYQSAEKAMTTRPSLVARAVGAFLAWWPVAAFVAFSALVTVVTGWHDFSDKFGAAFHSTSTAAKESTTTSKTGRASEAAAAPSTAQDR